MRRDLWIAEMECPATGRRWRLRGYSRRSVLHRARCQPGRLLYAVRARWRRP